MKKIFTLLLMLAGVTASAQQFNNEWIKFSQTYYKFKIATQGVVRIPKATLDAAGIGGTQVQFLELWRNGEKVPFYPSVSSGVLPSNGYLEFWGEPNDGKPDRDLYRSPLYQHRTNLSLETDTAVYFLSVNTDQSGRRYTDVVNNTGSFGTPEPWFMYTAGVYPQLQMNQGFAVDLKEYLYSSSYDKGEYWSTGDIYPGAPVPATFPPQPVFPGGPDAVVKYGMSGNALNARTVKITVNNSVTSNIVMDYFNDYVENGLAVPNGLISSGNVEVKFVNNSPVPSDRMVISFCEVIYPRQFKFDNTTKFKFTLPAKPAGYSLEIKEFNYGTTQPVLYDMAQGQRYVGDITTTPGSVLFVLPGSSSARDLVLVNATAGIANVNQLVSKTFIDFSKPAIQGDYIIITHPLFYSGTSGGNPINDYKVYRESSAGGQFKVMIAEIDELVDQFAFGIRRHPLSVRNFIRYARANFSQAPKNVFLIGRGMTYNEYRLHQTDPIIDRLNIIPTFGNPGSDNLLASADILSPVPATPIGRLSVVAPQEVSDYLVKLKQYEGAQQNSPNTLQAREWMKNVIQVTGSSDAYLGSVLCNYMGVYKQVIEDTAYGATVSTFCKNSTAITDEVASAKIAQLMEQGTSFLTYFGHSSATTLEFNLDNPQYYNNQGKYPVFFVNGCNAGNFFTYYPLRMVANETLSEKFTLAKERGTIAFLASTHFGIVNYLNLFLTNLYNTISHIDYDKSLGETNQHVFQAMLNTTGINDFYTRIHAEQMTLHGDPALMLNASPRPDYVIEGSSITVNPAFISIAESFFDVKVRVVNLGRAVKDSIVLEIKQQYPNNTSTVIYRQKIKGVTYADSVLLHVPIIATRDKGAHRLTVTIDAESAVTEVSESNNTATKDFYIFQDEARPVYPYNLSIINQPNQKLYVSTANPFSASRGYTMEIDTTELFNSSQKISKTVNAGGGVIEFDPQITYKDSTVYYWRVSPVPATSGGDYQWAASSFMSIANGPEGFNQSHYYQHTKTETRRIKLDPQDRKWKYGTRENVIVVHNGVFPDAASQAIDFSVIINDNDQIKSVCGVSGIIVTIIDPVTLKPWNNNASGPGLYGSDNVCGTNRRFQFQYNILDTAKRRKMVELLDLVPDGDFIVIRNISDSVYNSNTYAKTWEKDTSYLGSNNSIYHRLLAQGFTNIDSFFFPRAFIFTYKKNRQNEYAPETVFSKGKSDRISLNTRWTTPDTLGLMSSPVIGPAKKWKQLLWNGKNIDLTPGDNPAITVVGIDTTGIEAVLANVDRNHMQVDLSTIDAGKYPSLRLDMRNVDSVNLTPFQLDFWRIYYDPMPEGALAANMYLSGKDTLESGDILKFGIAFKNISHTNFEDSITVKATILDRSNVLHTIQMPKFKKLQTTDTITVKLDADTKLYPGMNTLYLEVNPDKAQPEQYNYNNFLYKNFFVSLDDKNPVLDVTFDGVHILNRDIVSAKPHIQIKLKDESKHLLLNDTALAEVQVKYPNGTTRTYHYDNDTLRFTPATTGSDNSMLLDFVPAFTTQFNPEGDVYELIVRGADKSGNKAGASEYRTSFKVINKPMISNLLNYPNPFSTSTAFVFTITGSEMPQNIKIQILTVTGKIVREITIDELGPLRIGRNITEFKWDGTDQYGQKLGNGVYLYRVVTSLNGKTMEKYKAKTDNTDQFFTNGYGKMYLMR